MKFERRLTKLKAELQETIRSAVADLEDDLAPARRRGANLHRLVAEAEMLCWFAREVIEAHAQVLDLPPGRSGLRDLDDDRRARCFAELRIMDNHAACALEVIADLRKRWGLPSAPGDSVEADAAAHGVTIAEQEAKMRRTVGPTPGGAGGDPVERARRTGKRFGGAAGQAGSGGEEAKDGIG